MPIHLIVARARNGVIGDRGVLPWRLPEDLAHFKRTTMGHDVVMGRKTWDSIGRPLPGRRNIVLTRDSAWHAPGAEVVHSWQDALAGNDHGRDVFVIGGAEIFGLALRGPVDFLHLTQIDADFAGDTHFPAPDPARWRECERRHFDPAGERSYGFDFIRYESRI
jgi:dihydrofolate reductase